ncbi:ParB/RepB/Spo0J family partition protein [Leptospira levettii]|uniref:ParB/RepB/Spo0J family partition protein n=1 Tax=Leptospira levettii TaxID=2023178 RepID=A0A6H3NM44_9LEPT|nr:ParB/RepB/Spo0J family partition protein [Leptospira levettii]MCW7467375.1 ParB/RepB/Spo0J family partition protein [Leptospira levettii]MCW7513097.1 ParB/RepB/Spo0J family partition protein [Leptospira levettii]MCW7516769.1 ParB/RepB/Spo0J family partition protein [Leptospira levettii]TGL74646.1 ParB/RepB/Spo0J family partition protein [Leptospira levettii]TGM26404.1 ParB/RepB/Spo0J family partition protein [Leptospira levettii]
MSKKTEFQALDLISAYSEKKKNPSHLELSQISPNPTQPRLIGREDTSDLLPSMERLGLIEPILVRKEKGKYLIVAGERRYRAALKLGWKEIPAIITDANEDVCYEMSLAENEKRKNLNPWEVGKAIQYLRKEKKKTADEVSILLGYSERYVKQLSSIARLDQKSVMELIISGKPLSVKNLEDLLKRKENRGGEIISPRVGLSQTKISINVGKLNSKLRESFLKELNSLKKKYGISE